MTERDEVLQKLHEARIPEALRWAYRSATRQVAEEFSEESGHDAGWAGYSRYVLIRDRLDRVFSCGRYALAADAPSGEGRDVVLATLSQTEIDSMPFIEPDVVKSSNLNNSIGWSYEGVRWLLASAPYRKLHAIQWGTKSPTKRLVARQRNFNPDQGSLFEELLEAELMPSWADLVQPDYAELDQLTLVLAHSQDTVSWQGELGIGMPRLNDEDGASWTWFENLLIAPPSKGGASIAATPAAPIDDIHLNEPDAPVRLREKKTTSRPAL
jgi:hypothetical protein